MEFLLQQPLRLFIFAGCGVLLAGVWCYLWLFHHRFWTTRIPPQDIRPAAARSAPAATLNVPLRETAFAAPVAGAAAVRKASACAAQWPAVLVVVPARNEAEVIGQTIRNILGQDYQGAIRLVVVNDNSEDATAAAALAAAESAGSADAPSLPDRSFTLIDGRPLPVGWSGKLWAVEQGIRAGLQIADSAEYCGSTACAEAQAPAGLNVAANAETGNGAAVAKGAAAAGQPDPSASCRHVAKPVGTPNPADTHHLTSTPFSPEFIWLTDADIAHEPQVLRELVARAQSGNYALASRMARLCTDSVAERWAIPAFVYFFQLLYPFRAVNKPRSHIHGAAGGCILLRRDYLPKIGGIASLKGALIDDCTLAANVARAGGGLHLELTQSSRSLRGYGGARGVSRMIARTAYTQLRYSPLRLLGTVFGLLFVFWGPLLVAALAACITFSGGTAGNAANNTATVPDAATAASLRSESSFSSSMQPPAAIASSGGATPSPAAVTPYTGHAAENSVPLIAALVGNACGSTGHAAENSAPLILFAIAGTGAAAAFVIMVGTFIPMLRFYRLNPLRAPALPLIATFYLWATLKSALHYYQGRSGNWKGRTYQEN